MTQPDDLVWDPDLTPEGLEAAAKLAVEIARHARLRGTGAGSGNAGTHANPGARPGS